MIVRLSVFLLMVSSSLAANAKSTSSPIDGSKKPAKTAEKRNDEGSQVPQKRGLYGLDAVEIAHAPPLPSFAAYSSTPAPLEYSSLGPAFKPTSPYPEVIIKPSSGPVPIGIPHPSSHAAYEDVHIVSSPSPPVPVPVPPHGVQLNPHVKEITITKEVPVPYYVHVEKKVPFPVYIQVPQPYPVTVEKHVPYQVRVPVDRPVPVPVPKPYPVHVAVEKPVPVPVEKPVPYPVRVPVDRPYPVHVPVEKPVPYPVQVLVDRPVHIPKPYPVHVPVEKHVPYPVHVPVEKHAPYPFKVPVPVDRPVPIIPAYEKNYHYYHQPEEPIYVKTPHSPAPSPPPYYYPQHQSHNRKSSSASDKVKKKKKKKHKKRKPCV